MHVATPNGMEPVRARSWPLANLDYPRVFSNGSHSIPFANLPGGGYQAATYEMVYRTNPWVFAANRAIARGVSRLVLKVYQNDKNGARERIRSDLPGSTGRRSVGQALDFLLRQPEPGVGRQEWLRKLCLDKGVYGNALVTKDRNPATGTVQSLWRVPWKRVTVQEGDDVPILYYEVRGRALHQEPRRFSPDDVIHFGRGTDVDSPIGISPLAPLKFTLALHDALWRHAVAYFANSARPSGMVKLDKGASQTIIDLVRSQVEALYTSPENAGKVLVTSGEWQSMTDSPDQAQIIELARLSREEVAAAYGIPQPMVGILDRSTFSNVTELRNYFQRDLIGVEASDFEDDLMAQLVLASPAWSAVFVEFDLGEALRPDLEKLGDLAQKMRSVMTPDEMREKFVGLNPLDIDESRTVWMPSGQIGLGIEPPAPEAPKVVKGPDGPIADEPVDPVTGDPADPEAEGGVAKGA